MASNFFSHPGGVTALDVLEDQGIEYRSGFVRFPDGRILRASDDLVQIIDDEAQSGPLVVSIERDGLDGWTRCPIAGWDENDRELSRWDTV